MLPHVRELGVHVAVPDGRPAGPVAEFGSLVGESPSWVMLFAQFSGSSSVPSFFTVRQAVASGLRAVLTIEPRVSLWELADGRFDVVLEQWAVALQPFGCVVRFAHEMNGDWYPWCRQPEVFRAAWRRVRRVFRGHAPSVEFMWCPNRQYDRHSAFYEYFPGDEWVDRVGLDAYNRGDPWRDPKDTADFDLSLLRALAPNKPLTVAEFGCAPGVERAAWFSEWWAWLDWTPVSQVFPFFERKALDWRWGEVDAERLAFRVGLGRWLHA